MSAEHVKNHIEMEIAPLCGALKFGDVPTPEFVGTSGQKLGLLIDYVTCLISSLTHLGVCRKYSIHRVRISE